MTPAPTYKIVRLFFQSSGRKTLKRGLTLEQAQSHCLDPESSSDTATGLAAIALTKRRGPWFDGYYLETTKRRQS